MKFGAGWSAKRENEKGDGDVPDENGGVLSKEGRELLNQLLKPGIKIETVLPEAPTCQQLWDTLRVCSSGLSMLENRVTRLKPIIGKLLLMFENKPSYYKDLGYASFNAFCKKGVCDTLGLGVSTMYECLGVARKWPQLTPERYVKVKRGNLRILSAFATGRSHNVETYLQAAESMKVPEFRQFCDQRGLVPSGDTLPSTLTVHMTVTQYRDIHKVLSDPRVQSHVGSPADWGSILHCVLFQERYTHFNEEREEEERSNHASEN